MALNTQSTPLHAHDPNERQILAADPLASVWVSASAGTGKTKILTDRVLRLMLPRTTAESMAIPATRPDKILCLTYTKTAAAEMADRIHSRLSEWSIIPDAELSRQLQDLTGTPASTDLMDAARALFAQVVDTPGGMKIMTIHSFCQAVLKRFPLEAGLPAHFEVLESRTAKEYLNRAQRRVIEKVAQEPDSLLAQAFINISSKLNADQFNTAMQEMIGKSKHMSALGRYYPQTEDLKNALFKMCGFDGIVTEHEFLLDNMAPSSKTLNTLRTGLDVLYNGTKTDQEKATRMQSFLETVQSHPEQAANHYGTYIRAFLKSDGIEPYKDPCTKKIRENQHELAEAMQIEAERLSELQDRLKSISLAYATFDMLVVGRAIIQSYERIKSINSQLDFDDMIYKTEALLSDPVRAGWVLYKMDQGLDHILVDEAQDTSPAQWSMIRALSEEFFSGYSARDDVLRTVFVVGDEKQSIYSFQGADPEQFTRMRQHFDEKIKQAEKEFRPVNLLMSFRSTAAILQTVDRIFSEADIARGVQMDASINVHHEPFRIGHAGHVELWPPIQSTTTEALTPWTPPDRLIYTENAAVRLAEKIAETIAGWLKHKDVLTAKGRPIRAGDIMILFRRRGQGGLLDQTVRALKDRNIPVSGVDRLILSDHLAVQDCLALAECGLLPEDDLTLATILKSPFIGYDEDQLFRLSYNRTGTLWQSLKQNDPDVYSYIRNTRTSAMTRTPYDFMQDLLVKPCPADSNSGRRALYSRLGTDIDDPLEELLNAALDFERLNSPLLQHFVDWFIRGKSEIKREQESAHIDQVRLMTVHGSKGLQAPIVFLPDTMDLPDTHRFTLLWPEDERDIPLWPQHKNLQDKKAASLQENYIRRQQEEYRRLLYVALTRAEDRLYICGAQTQKDVKPDSWYDICRRMMQQLEGIKTKDFYLQDDILCDTEGTPLKTIYFENPQTVTVKTAPPHKDVQAYVPDFPEILRRPPPEEPNPPRPLAPARPSDMEPAVKSPLAHDTQLRYARGNLIHQLLEYLPELPKERRQMAAEKFLAQSGLELSAPAREEILTQIMTILQDPRFASLFGPNSRAEVPVVGLIDSLPNEKYYAMSGQIDRMVIEDHRILIVDYKTNRTPPLNEDDIPAIYWRQMAAYQTILEKIYPDKTIECALLWTDAARLMPLSPEKLQKYRKI